jgi:hypothetical protein
MPDAKVDSYKSLCFFFDKAKDCFIMQREYSVLIDYNRQ